MKIVTDYLRELVNSTAAGWNRFWFTPADAATLGMIRIAAGAMLFYTHLVWGKDLEAFFGADPWLADYAVAAFQDARDGGRFAWSYLWWLKSPAALWTAHVAGLVVFALLTIGLFTRTAAVLAFIVTLAYVNRASGAMFGLDQINCMLAMYLMVGSSGDAYSVDRWRAALRAGEPLPLAAPTTSTNIATRLIQVHMCIIYLFAGIAKLQGETWWNGSAMWGAVANYEYQSLDMTWMGEFPILVAAFTHVTVFWEVSYAALVWPRLTRPLVIAIALPLHLGICFFLGMITFGLAMLIGNAAFVSPALVRSVVDHRLPVAARGAAGAKRRATKSTAARATSAGRRLAT